MPGEELLLGAEAAKAQAAIAAAETGANVTGNMLSQRWQRKWLEKTYEKQKADALEAWNRENAYNSPQQQMQRLKEAGLNPNLVYGNKAMAEGGSMSMPKYGSYTPQAPQIDTSGIRAAVGNQFVYGQIEAQTDNVKAVTARTIAETLKVNQETQTEMQRLQNMITDREAQLKNMDLTDAKRSQVEQEIEKLKMQNFILGETVDDSIEQIRADLRQTNANVLLTEAQMHYYHKLTQKEAQALSEAIRTFPDRQNAIKLQNTYLEARTALERAQQDATEQNVQKLKMETDRLEQLMKKDAHWANSPEAGFFMDIFKTAAGIFSLSGKLPTN